MQQNKTIIFLQDGINSTNSEQFLYHDLDSTNFSYIILISTSTDSKIIYLVKEGYEDWSLEEIYNDDLPKKDKRKLVSLFLMTSENVDSIIALFGCNLHVLSNFKK